METAMSRKFNVKHNRKRSNYPKRLAKRGLSKAPVMPTLEELRKRAYTRNPQHENDPVAVEALTRIYTGS